LKLDPCLSACTKINSKKIKDLKVRPEKLRIVQKRAGTTIKQTGIGNEFLNRTQMAQQLRERMHKWDYMKLKRFCTTKEIVTRLKSLPTEWENIFASYTSDKGMYRVFKRLISPKFNDGRRNGQMY
jgi:hypothetical protein